MPRRLVLPRDRLSGSTRYDRAQLVVSADIVGVCIPAGETGRCLKALARDLLSIPRAPRVVANPEDPTTRILLLRDDIDPVWDADSTHIIHAHGISDSTAQLLRTNGWPLVQHTVTLDHQHWSAIEILEALLPADAADFGCSFETVGHIAHLNLRDELLPYRKMIGEVILDVGTSKNGPKIRTVVTKTGNIETKFRTFPMEVIAGDEDFEATVSENGCRFRFDFSRVYWNSRLGHEHERVLKLFHAGDIICDVFAGVGPFALPANKSGCIVYANDLNPYSYEAIRANAALNKIAVGGDSSRLHIYNEDGRTFIRHVLHDVRRNVERAGDADKKRTTPQHFVMNLPALAIEFLDAFAGVFREAFGENAERVDQSAMPWVHCHCFSKSETPEADVVERTETIIGHKLTDIAHSVHYVRKVAPNKDMLCISFQLPVEVAYREAPIAIQKREGEKVDDDTDSAVACKRLREDPEIASR